MCFPRKCGCLVFKSHYHYRKTYLPFYVCVCWAVCVLVCHPSCLPAFCGRSNNLSCHTPASLILARQAYFLPVTTAPYFSHSLHPSIHPPSFIHPLRLHNNQRSLALTVRWNGVFSEPSSVNPTHTHTHTHSLSLSLSLSLKYNGFASYSLRLLSKSFVIPLPFSAAYRSPSHRVWHTYTELIVQIRFVLISAEVFDQCGMGSSLKTGSA